MKTILRVWICIVFVSFFFSLNTVGKTLISYDRDSIILADSLVLYYLDGKIGDHDWIMKLYDEEKVTGYGFRNPREAIRNCGEKARNGILLFETKK